MSRNPRGEDEVDADVSSRLSSINGYGSRRGAAQIGSRALEEAKESPDITPLPPDELDEDDPLRAYDGGEGPAYARDDVDDDFEDGDTDGHHSRQSDDGDAYDDVDGYDDVDAYDDDVDESDGTYRSGDAPGSDDPGAAPSRGSQAHDAAAQDWYDRLRAVDVHHVTFPRAPLMRRGYDERSVDEFLSRVEAEMVLLVEERADLRDRVSRLERQARAAQGAPVPQMEEAQAQAVRLLAKAQQLADQYVAEAEDYSKRIAQDARQQYDDTVAEARADAARAIDEANETATGLVEEANERAAALLQQAEEAAQRAAAQVQELPATAQVVATSPVDSAALQQSELERQALEEQVAYLRTFGQVCRTQLRAYLEALLQDVEEEWGKADPGTAAEVRPAGDSLPRAGRGGAGRRGARRPPASAAPDPVSPATGT